MPNNKEYKINIDPRILELLGPLLYTNIYYVLSELIANAYDADAKNVYIIEEADIITVEDDGKGMSYNDGEIAKYLDVAAVSRTNEENATTKELNRPKMGRKGIGKISALSVSEEVDIKTVTKQGEKSGFVLSRRINQDNLLTAIPEEEITFKKITNSGTAVVMKNPQYKLNATPQVIKKNILKLFPAVDENFVIHVIKNGEEIIINSFDENMIKELSTLITIGDDFSHLTDLFNTDYDDIKSDILKKVPTKIIPIKMTNNEGVEKDYNIEINGWIGTYYSTANRRKDILDFPDNFLSIYANKKLGEFNILPVVGQNKLTEVFVVGQLHVDIFELTELPDMALSNRQGYKSDDVRYVEVQKYARELLAQIIEMRNKYVDRTKKEKENKKLQKQAEDEQKLKEQLVEFIDKSVETVNNAMDLTAEEQNKLKANMESAANKHLNLLGFKSKVDGQKKKILISHTGADKDLATLIYDMLIFNYVPAEDIIFTSCTNHVSRIPPNVGIFNYLRTFFVDSVSDEKMYVIFVTSQKMHESWGAVVEVGAAWITRKTHTIFNNGDYQPKEPLDISPTWNHSQRYDGKIVFDAINADDFCVRIEDVCDAIYKNHRSRDENKEKLAELATVN